MTNSPTGAFGTTRVTAEGPPPPKTGSSATTSPTTLTTRYRCSTVYDMVLPSIVLECAAGGRTTRRRTAGARRSSDRRTSSQALQGDPGLRRRDLADGGLIRQRPRTGYDLHGPLGEDGTAVL